MVTELSSVPERMELMNLTKIDAIEAIENLKTSGQLFNELFNHGTLSVEVFSPKDVDNQKPHDKDEIYVIISGYSNFILENEMTEVKQGDFLFVPAGKEHRFEAFSDDFSTWVFFYGPKGGEKKA